MATLQIGIKEEPEGVAVKAKRLGRVFLKRFVPVTTWSRTVTRRELLDDAIGGFIVGVMVIPTCLSWASLAGLPLSCGLSAALVASFSYGTFGSCAVLSLGPVAEITTLLISIPGIAPADRKETYQGLGVQVGLLSMILSFMDGGKVIKTVFAKAVGDGYTCAAALLAICVQIKVMFNLQVTVSPPPTLLQDVLYYTFLAFKEQATLKSIYCFLLFMVYCTYLIYIKKCGLPLWIPHQLIVVAVSTCLTAFFRLDQKLGLSVVGDIESALSLPHFPPWHNVIGLGPYTITVTMISFIQMYVIAQRVMPDLDANAELFASGMTNFLCNIFSGMPVTNSLSCSSVLLEQHVHTPFTAYVVGSILLITILFLTKLFYFLPKQALGAIVVASVWRLLDFSGPFMLWRYSRMDAAVWVLTFLLTVFGGITIGVLSGIALSLVLIVLRIARPRAVTVGFNMKTFRYGDLQQDPELLVYPNILMWRFDAPLYFINTSYFEERLIAAIKNEVRPIDVVLVTCGKVNDIDAAALASIPTALETVSRTIKDRPIRIILTDIHGRLEKVLLESAQLPIYTSEEYDGLSISDLQKAGKKFPVVFKKLEDAIRFAQKLISEKYGNVDTNPYPNVSFLTDVVVDMTRQIENRATGTDRSTALLGAESGGGGGDDDAVGVYVSPTTNNEVAAEQLTELERLKRISKFSPDRELIGVMGVVRHAELTPKQKLKITFWDPEMFQAAMASSPVVASPTSGTGGSSKRTVEQLKPLFDLVAKKRAEGTLDDAESWERVRVILESRPRGLKLQIKAVTNVDASSFNETLVMQRTSSVFRDGDPIDSAMLIVKWGGVLTQPGVAQARVLGEKLFARFFAAGDLPLHRLVDFIHNSTIVASDETRVVDTALVVMNALTRQTVPLTKKDVKVDDPLLKTLNTPAKILLQEEYRYFEALMHISSSAAARHFFHLPGFRELLLIPELDRPFMPTTLSGASEEMHDVSFTHESSLGQEMSRAFSMAPNGALRAPRTQLTAFDDDEVIDRMENDQTFAAHLAAEANEDLYYTPLQVLSELAEKLEIVSTCPLPKELLDFKLSNHETVREMRARYATLLQNIRGAKRQRRADIAARRRADRRTGSGGDEDNNNTNENNQDDLEEEDDSDAEDARKRTAPPPFAAAAARRNTSAPASAHDTSAQQTDSERVSVAGTSTAGDEEEDDDADSHDPVLREILAARDDNKKAGASETAGSPREETSGSFARSDATRLPHSARRHHRRAGTPPPMPASSSLRAKVQKSTARRLSRGEFSPDTSRRKADDDSDDDDAGHRRHDSPRRSQSVPSRPASTAAAAELKEEHSSTYVFSPLGPHMVKGITHYDITDLTKLRDYGSYDSAYNLPLLHSLAATTGMPSLRRILYAFERFANITACMATVSENILVGVNSSKRFIIGSLVSGKLLRRLQTDIREIAKKDVDEGVKELLDKARALYMSEHSNIREDARSVLRKVRDGVCACCDSSEAEAERARAASEAEREFRLRFPFVNLPGAVSDAPHLSSPQPHSPTAKSDTSNTSYTRFYFTSYIHVEGLLQCLYESDTVHGFLKPSKQEEEVSMQNYMKHVLFKVFRRRNVSFTDDQALESFRRLNLTFRSDAPYERQQRDLLRGLVQTYHSMYYVSVEVYLSLGDAAVSARAPDDAAGRGPGGETGNVLLFDTPYLGSMFDGSAGGGGLGGLGDPAAYTYTGSPTHSPHSPWSPHQPSTNSGGQTQKEDARNADEDEDDDEANHSGSGTGSGSSPRNRDSNTDGGDDDDAAHSSLSLHSNASTASPTHASPSPLTGFHTSADASHPASGVMSSRASVNPIASDLHEPAPSNAEADAATGERLRALSLSFAQMPRLDDSEGAGLSSPSLLLTRPSAADASLADVIGTGTYSFNSANDSIRAAAQAALAAATSPSSAAVSAPASVAAARSNAPSPLGAPALPDAAAPERPLPLTSLAPPSAVSTSSLQSPLHATSASRGRHHRRHHHHSHNTSSLGAAGGAGGAGPSSTAAMSVEGSPGSAAALVLTTPEEGRKTAQVQEMLYRASTVTPMRRIHEGLSLTDFRQLVGEALSAALSQARPDRLQTQEW